LLALDIGQLVELLAIDLERVEQDAVSPRPPSLIACWSAEKPVRPWASRATISPSSRALPSRSPPAASAISGNLSVQSRPVRV